MKKSSFKYFAIGICLIAICLILAYMIQSAYLLFTASILPVLILPFLPDIRTNQTIEPLKSNKSIQVYGIADENQTAKYVVIEFKPGKIHWSKHVLYFSADHVALAPTSSLKQDAAALPIHKPDLVLKKGKYRWVGIRLNNLPERASSFPLTLKKVNRLVISIEDIKELFQEKKMNSRKRTASKGKPLQA
jgi:hypothetical protein